MCYKYGIKGYTLTLTHDCIFSTKGCALSRFCTASLVGQNQEKITDMSIQLTYILIQDQQNLIVKKQDFFLQICAIWNQRLYSYFDTCIFSIKGCMLTRFCLQLALQVRIRKKNHCHGRTTNIHSDSRPTNCEKKNVFFLQISAIWHQRLYSYFDTCLFNQGVYANQWPCIHSRRTLNIHTCVYSCNGEGG